MNSQHFNWAIFQKDLTWFLCLCYFSSTPAYFWSPIPCIMKKCSGAGMRTPAFSFWYRCYCTCNKRVRKLKLRCKKLESLYSSHSLESCHLSQWQKEPTDSTLYSGYLRWNVMSHSKVQGEEAKTILRVILDVESSSKNWSTEEQPHITTSPFTRQGHLTPKQWLPDDHGWHASTWTKNGRKCLAPSSCCSFGWLGVRGKPVCICLAWWRACLLKMHVLTPVPSNQVYIWFLLLQPLTFHGKVTPCTLLSGKAFQWAGKQPPSPLSLRQRTCAALSNFSFSVSLPSLYLTTPETKPYKTISSSNPTHFFF